jgi:hypothetical protein
LVGCDLPSSNGTKRVQKHQNAPFRGQKSRTISRTLEQTPNSFFAPGFGRPTGALGWLKRRSKRSHRRPRARNMAAAVSPRADYEAMLRAAAGLTSALVAAVGRENVAGVKSAATGRAYQSDLTISGHDCGAARLDALPAWVRTVAAYHRGDGDFTDHDVACRASAGWTARTLSAECRCRQGRNQNSGGRLL